MIRIVSWNIAKQHQPWRELAAMDVDIALVQEGGQPPDDVNGVEIGPKESYDSHHWNSDWWKGRGWPALYDRWPMVVKLSDRVEVEWFKQVTPITEVAEDEIAVSGIGIIAAARVTPKDGTAEPFIVVSMYARWIGPHPTTKSSWGVGYSDASVHRIISDISAFIGHEDTRRHRIIAAGDLNTGHGYAGEPYTGDPYWEARDRSVFDRMNAIGLEFMGPQSPNGRQADPTPAGLPPDTRNVPTYYTIAQKKPENAQIQLDYVFASRGFHESVSTRALNEVEEWGPSDHCRILIEIDS